jgi:hypothetical protein
LAIHSGALVPETDAYEIVIVSSFFSWAEAEPHDKILAATISRKTAFKFFISSFRFHPSAFL